AHRRLESANGALGDFGRGDELANGGAQRLLVSAQQAQLLAQPHAIEDREQQQNCHHALDHEAELVAHCASSRLLVPSAFSNMANVVFGGRKVLSTRTATRSPTLPMRPWVKVTSPQRTFTSASGLSSSI